MKNNLLRIKDAVNIIDEVDYYILDIKDVESALRFVKRFKTFADALEKKVKEKSSEIMEEEMVSVIDTEEFEIRRMEAGNTKQYSVSSVIEAFGTERATPLLSVRNKEFETYVSMGLRNGGVKGDEAEKAHVGIIKKTRKGYIRISKKR